VIAAIFAASMSSLSGGINSITSVIAGDLMPRRNRERWVGSRAFSRWVTLACGIVGSLLALAVAAMPVRSLFDVFIEFTNLLSGSLAGVFVLALFGDRFRTLDATAGFVVSLLVVAAAKASGGLSFMLYGTLGTAACLVTALLTAQIFPRHRNPVQVSPSAGTTGHPES
jgi:Na+/proline symporter